MAENGATTDSAAPSTWIAKHVQFPLPSTVAHTQPLRIRPPAAAYPSEQPKQTRSQVIENPSIGTDIASTAPAADPRHQRLQNSIRLLQAQIAEKEANLNQNLNLVRQHGPDLAAESEDIVAQRAAQIVSRHIKLLHQYNEIKDIGLGLMGLIADQQGKRLSEIMSEYNMDHKD